MKISQEEMDDFYTAIPPSKGSLIMSKYGGVFMSMETLFDLVFGDEMTKAKWYHSIMKWKEQNATQQET